MSESDEDTGSPHASPVDVSARVADVLRAGNLAD